MLILHYHDFMEILEVQEGKKYLVVYDYMVDKVLDKIQEIISIEKI